MIISPNDLAEKRDFNQKLDFWPKICIFDRKFGFLTENLDFWPKVWIFDRKFGQNFPLLTTIYEKFDFWSRFGFLMKISTFDQNVDSLPKNRLFFLKCRFFLKILIFSEHFDFSANFDFFSENFDFFLKISIYFWNFRLFLKNSFFHQIFDFKPDSLYIFPLQIVAELFFQIIQSNWRYKLVFMR